MIAKNLALLIHKLVCIHTCTHTQIPNQQIGFHFILTPVLTTLSKFYILLKNLGSKDIFLRNIQIQTCFFCACLFWAPSVADLKLRDLDCLLTLTESLRRSYEKDDDFFVIFLLGVSAISSTKVWLPSSKQCPKKIKSQYHQAFTTLKGNSFQSYKKWSNLQGREPT